MSSPRCGLWRAAIGCALALLVAEHHARRTGRSDRWRTANITLAWLMILATVLLWIPLSFFLAIVSG